MGVLSSGRYMVQAAAIHVARYAFYIGPDLNGMTLDEKTAAIAASVSTVKTIFQVCAIVGMFGATLLMPMLMKKFDYKKLHYNLPCRLCRKHRNNAYRLVHG